ELAHQFFDARPHLGTLLVPSFVGGYDGGTARGLRELALERRRARQQLIVLGAQPADFLRRLVHPPLQILHPLDRHVGRILVQRRQPRQPKRCSRAALSPRWSSFTSSCVSERSSAPYWNAIVVFTAPAGTPAP